MKLIDKIAYICFWLSILFFIGIFIVLPFLFINYPGFLEKMRENGGINPINLTFLALNFGAFFLWGYCIWFLFKFDRYSKSIFLLFFFNALYAPIYYYRVKINKRPLRNRVFYPVEEQTQVKTIGDDEFIELTRRNIINVLELWSSANEQIKYQESQPDIQVSKDLFDQWIDFYFPSSDTLNEAFTANELIKLKEFDRILNENKGKLAEGIPDIDEFILTAEWYELNTLANKILPELQV